MSQEDLVKRCLVASGRYTLVGAAYSLAAGHQKGATGVRSSAGVCALTIDPNNPEGIPAATEVEFKFTANTSLHLASATYAAGVLTITDTIATTGTATDGDVCWEIYKVFPS